MGFLRDVVLRAAAGLFAHVLIQVVLALIPAALGIVALILGGPPSVQTWTAVALAGGWSISGLLAVAWFQDHYAKRTERIIVLARTFYSSDRIIRDLIRRDTSPRERELIFQKWADMALGKLCGSLAHRVPIHRKGATLFILLGHGDNSRLDLFAQYNHADPEVPQEVRLHVTPRKSLAALAIRDHSCKVIRDCKSPPKGLEWAEGPLPPRFRGRAAAPVATLVDGKILQIGAVCLDVSIPWDLSAEDQRLLQLFGEKMAAVWVLAHTESSPSSMEPERQQNGNASLLVATTTEVLSPT
jgi:hypothetical protein